MVITLLWRNENSTPQNDSALQRMNTVPVLGCCTITFELMDVVGFNFDFNFDH